MGVGEKGGGETRRADSFKTNGKRVSKGRRTIKFWTGGKKKRKGRYSTIQKKGTSRPEEGPAR